MVGYTARPRRYQQRDASLTFRLTALIGRGTIQIWVYPPHPDSGGVRHGVGSWRLDIDFYFVIIMARFDGYTERKP